MNQVVKSVRSTFYILVMWMISGFCAYAGQLDVQAVTGCPALSYLAQDSWERNSVPLIDSIRSQEDYEERINQIESEAGAFSYDLASELIGLALLHREAGEYVKTINILQRAFYIIRINDGLYSTSQVPVLELMIQSESALGEWKTVADEYDHLYWLYRRNYGADDARLLPFLKRLRQWHIGAYNKDTGRSLGEHFNIAKDLYVKVMDILKACGGDERIALCFWNKECCSDSDIENSSCPADKS